MMHIISKTTLTDYWTTKKPDSKNDLVNWINITKKAEWQNPNEVKNTFPDVSILKNNRAVFNIQRNQYRLIVYINYIKSVIYIVWVGTHTEYDTIDANKVWDY
jgi:mRNA interferase HigB